MKALLIFSLAIFYLSTRALAADVEEITLDPGVYKVMYHVSTFKVGAETLALPEFRLTLLRGQAGIIDSWKRFGLMSEISETTAQGTAPENDRVFYTVNRPKGVRLSSEYIREFQLIVLGKSGPATFIPSLDSANKLFGIFKEDGNCVYPRSVTRYQDISSNLVKGMGNDDPGSSSQSK